MAEKKLVRSRDLGRKIMMLRLVERDSAAPPSDQTGGLAQDAGRGRPSRENVAGQQRLLRSDNVLLWTRRLSTPSVSHYFRGECFGIGACKIGRRGSNSWCTVDPQTTTKRWTIALFSAACTTDWRWGQLVPVFSCPDSTNHLLSQTLTRAIDVTDKWPM